MLIRTRVVGTTICLVLFLTGYIGLSEYGLKVRELFKNPARVRRYISTNFNVTQDVAESVMRSELSFQGVSYNLYMVLILVCAFNT